MCTLYALLSLPKGRGIVLTLLVFCRPIILHRQWGGSAARSVLSAERMKADVSPYCCTLRYLNPCTPRWNESAARLALPVHLRSYEARVANFERGCRRLRSSEISFSTPQRKFAPLTPLSCLTARNVNRRIGRSCLVHRSDLIGKTSMNS